ncbi:hypothetical protein TTHERM_00647000 (macronuclear) [Tetrahymena thermophila SB210]|uniref:Uncharacterized protein n=1 Tax=Tetrahymena thermophila (strain SB210) TaxID=312017 RepID=I7MJT0_TETTS|nr:hypothetical protein TTHERM_00647000 [Tetrahymena thermophila SB210]EAS07167.2 hypothetical protein TTHERM_00647000 [Tetrahymena thermophila SB210]|eukprot:XP_001027409.2 hypothetical protein TTHERM_00647000 [Tetrahymena thermophila SB210]
MQVQRQEKIQYFSIQYKLQLSDIINFKRGQDPKHDENFMEEVNEFYKNQFEEIQEKLEQYHLFQNFDEIDPEQIKHNTCALIGTNNTWNFSLIFQKYGYESRNKSIELKEFRYCQASQLKKVERQNSNLSKFELRIVKQIDPEHRSASTKYGDFMICHFLCRNQLKNCSKQFKQAQNIQISQNKADNLGKIDENKTSANQKQKTDQEKQIEDYSNNSNTIQFIQKPKEEYQQHSTPINQQEQENLLFKNPIKNEKKFINNDQQRFRDDNNELIQDDQNSMTINLQEQDQQTSQNERINLNTINKQQNSMQFNLQSSSISEKIGINEVPQLNIGQVKPNQELSFNYEKPQSNSYQNIHSNQSHRASNGGNFYCKQEHDQQSESQKDKYISYLENKVKDLEFELNREKLKSAKESMRMFYLKHPDYEPYKKFKRDDVKSETIEID